MNKKGVFFTILSIFISVMLVALFSYETEYPVDAEVEINKYRISFFHNFNNDLRNSYLERALYVGIYNGLDQAIDHIEDDDFFNSVDELTSFLNGCLEGTNPECSDDAKFSFWADKIKDKVYDDFGIELDYELSGDIYLNQTRPFSVFVSVPVTYELSDDFVLKLWDSIVLEAEVSITGLKDPFLFENNVERIIYRDPVIELGYDETEEAYENFIEHYDKGTYVMTEIGPSFLDRLQGLTSPNENGIQTLLEEGSVTHYNNMSYIDYKYFSGLEYSCGDHSDTKLYSIVGINSNFRIDWNNLANYRLGGVQEMDFAPGCGG